MIFWKRLSSCVILLLCGGWSATATWSFAFARHAPLPPSTRKLTEAQQQATNEAHSQSNGPCFNNSNNDNNNDADTMSACISSFVAPASTSYPSHAPSRSLLPSAEPTASTGPTPTPSDQPSLNPTVSVAPTRSHAPSAIPTRSVEPTQRVASIPPSTRRVPTGSPSLVPTTAMRRSLPPQLDQTVMPSAFLWSSPQTQTQRQPTQSPPQGTSPRATNNPSLPSPPPPTQDNSWTRQPLRAPASSSSSSMTPHNGNNYHDYGPTCPPSRIVASPGVAPPTTMPGKLAPSTHPIGQEQDHLPSPPPIAQHPVSTRQPASPTTMPVSASPASPQQRQPVSTRTFDPTWIVVTPQPQSSPSSPITPGSSPTWHPGGGSSTITPSQMQRAPPFAPWSPSTAPVGIVRPSTLWPTVASSMTATPTSKHPGNKPPSWLESQSPNIPLFKTTNPTTMDRRLPTGSAVTLVPSSESSLVQAPSIRPEHSQSPQPGVSSSVVPISTMPSSITSNTTVPYKTTFVTDANGFSGSSTTCQGSTIPDDLSSPINQLITYQYTARLETTTSVTNVVTALEAKIQSIMVQTYMKCIFSVHGPLFFVDSVGSLPSDLNGVTDCSARVSATGPGQCYVVQGQLTCILLFPKLSFNNNTTRTTAVQTGSGQRRQRRQQQRRQLGQETLDDPNVFTAFSSTLRRVVEEIFSHPNVLNLQFDGITNHKNASTDNVTEGGGGRGDANGISSGSVSTSGHSGGSIVGFTILGVAGVALLLAGLIVARQKHNPSKQDQSARLSVDDGKKDLMVVSVSSQEYIDDPFGGSLDDESLSQIGDGFVDPYNSVSVAGLSTVSPTPVGVLVSKEEEQDESRHYMKRRQWSGSLRAYRSSSSVGSSIVSDAVEHPYQQQQQQQHSSHRQQYDEEDRSMESYQAESIISNEEQVDIYPVSLIAAMPFDEDESFLSGIPSVHLPMTMDSTLAASAHPTIRFESTNFRSSSNNSNNNNVGSSSSLQLFSRQSTTLTGPMPPPDPPLAPDTVNL